MADELKVLCAGGFRAAMERIAPAFEAAQGLKLDLAFATPGRTRELLEAGFGFDSGVVVASVLAKAAAEGLRVPREHFKLAVSPLGLGVPEGGPRLAVGTVAELAASVEALESIALSDPKAGTNVANEVLAAADRAGFGEALRSKVVFVNGPGSVVSAQVAAGLAQAVITLSSEIVPADGIRFCGRLPAEMQTEYAMEAVVADGAGAEVRAFVSYLRGEDAHAAMEAVGLEVIAVQ